MICMAAVPQAIQEHNEKADKPASEFSKWLAVTLPMFPTVAVVAAMAWLMQGIVQ